MVAAVAAVVVVAGCDSGVESVEHPEADEAWEIVHDREVDDGDVVADVDGRVITRGDVEAMWREDPEADVTEIVDRLVERELIAEHAYREGVHRRPEVAFARKQGMVSALLYEAVEQEATPDDADREQMIQYVQSARRVPEGLRVSHLAVIVGDEIEDEERDEKFDRARRVADEALDRLDGRVDDDALREVAAGLNEEGLEEGLEVVVDEHMRIPRPDEVFEPQHLPSGWTAAVAAFAESADRVADDEYRGRLTEPVETRFGWHLIRVDEVIEAREVDSDVAEAFVDYEIETGARQRRFGQQMEEWLDGVGADVYPERIDPESAQPF